MSRTEPTPTRLDESRRKVEERLATIGRAADREAAKAERVKDAILAVFGVVGALLAARRLGQAIRHRGKSKKARPERAEETPRPEEG